MLLVVVLMVFMVVLMVLMVVLMDRFTVPASACTYGIQG